MSQITSNKASRVAFGIRIESLRSAASLLTPLKIGFLASFYFALLSTSPLHIRMPAAMGGTVLMIALVIRKVTFAKKDLLIAVAVSAGLVGLCLVFRRSDPIYAGWYFILFVLLQFATGETQVRPLHRSGVNRLVDALCAIHLAVIAAASFYYFESSVSLLNPNVSAALCGYLLMVYLIENEITNSLPIARYLIVLSSAVLVAQRSRSALIWFIAAYFLYHGLKRNEVNFSSWLVRALVLMALLLALSPAVQGSDFDVSVVSDWILSMPSWIRTKDGGLDSDVLRFVQYPALLASHMNNSSDLWFGLGIGAKPYLEQLQDGEDLHNAFLVAMSDGGLLLLLPLLYFSLRNGPDSVSLAASRAVVFLSASVFAGIYFGLAPFTISIALLFVAARAACR
jgi:hypothetical protein